jgi:hypothetical protein
MRTKRGIKSRLMLYLVLAAALPFACLAIVIPVNIYQDIGFDGVDCDGPMRAMIFSLPTLAIYGFGAVLLYRGNRTGLDRVLAAACLCVALAVGWKLVTAIRETSAATEACGESAALLTEFVKS